MQVYKYIIKSTGIDFFTFYATTGAIKCNHQLVVATTGAFSLTSVCIGNFLLEIGKKHTFCHWEHDAISVVKIGQKKTADKSDLVYIVQSHIIFTCSLLINIQSRKSKKTK